MKKPYGTKTISFRVGAGQLAQQIASRDESHANEIAKRDLERYYNLLGRSLATVDLTEAEANALCDANNGTLWENWSISLLWANVADTPGLDEKWGIDSNALIGKIRSWSHPQALAVVDAIERFWTHCDTATAKTVGLVREDL